MLGRVVVVTSGNFSVAESTMLPIGNIGGTAYMFLDGSKVNKLDRSDFVLGWCMEQLKPVKPEKEEASKRLAKKAATKAKKKSVAGVASGLAAAAQSPGSSEKKKVVTHTLSWKKEKTPFPIEASADLVVEFFLPSLVPVPQDELPEADRLGQELRRAHYTWPQDVLDFLAMIKVDNKLSKNFAML